jgi:hypothetical protein
MKNTTPLLNAAGQGGPHAACWLLPLVYQELRKLAAQRMAQEKRGRSAAELPIPARLCVRRHDFECSGRSRAKRPYWPRRNKSEATSSSFALRPI